MMIPFQSWSKSVEMDHREWLEEWSTKRKNQKRGPDYLIFPRRITMTIFYLKISWMVQWRFRLKTWFVIFQFPTSNSPKHVPPGFRREDRSQVWVNILSKRIGKSEPLKAGSPEWPEHCLNSGSRLCENGSPSRPDTLSWLRSKACSRFTESSALETALLQAAEWKGC